MTATTNPHSAPAGRSDELHALAVQLYGLISSGHDALAYNIDARGAALTAVGADGKRRPVQTGGGEAGPPVWQRARELRDGVEVDRRFNAWVLGRHLRGRYSVAPAAAGWVQWVALDIDAHSAAGSPDLVARRLAKERADRVLASVWRALGCSAERHPLVLRSPGGGYHVWFPLTRGPTSTNPEHTWPAAFARAWFERHVVAVGLELAPGVLEVFPSGRCLRAPCGLGMQLLRATRPDDPDALGLVPWPGTMADSRVDWRGDRPALSVPVRRVVPMLRTFLAQWEVQRRTLAEWLGRPEASWDPTWGFLGWRDEGPEDRGGPVGEISSAEKNSAPFATAGSTSSQELVDVPGRFGGRRLGVSGGGRSGTRRSAREGRGAAAVSDEILIPPSARDVDRPLDLAGDPVVRGRAFREKVQGLLTRGVTEPSTRHDAVLTLAFYWAATCGLGEVGALARLDAWCKAHPHEGSRLSHRPRLFRDTCVREAAHYITHHSPRWRFTGKGDGGGLATLSPADQAVVSAADPRVQGEVAAILAWLAGRADGEGRIAEPVQIATGLLARLCGDRRVDEGGKRRRTTTLAMAELERLGVLTLARQYCVGQRGRAWCCWYRFGSGELPRAVEITSAAWSAIAPEPECAGRVEVPLAAEAEGELALQDGSASVAPSAAPAPVTVRVLGERDVPEGVIQVLSDGVRGAPRTLLAVATDVGRPTVRPESREPWFVRMFQRRTFTPAELLVADAAKVIPMPDLEARRRMTRRERLARAKLAPAAVVPLRSPATGDLAVPMVHTPMSAPIRAAPGPVAEHALDPRAELAAEIGAEAAAGLPLDVAEVAAHAWRAFLRRSDA